MVSMPSKFNASMPWNLHAIEKVREASEFRSPHRSAILISFRALAMGLYMYLDKTLARQIIRVLLSTSTPRALELVLTRSAHISLYQRIVCA